jgi:hypothetical protein
MELVINKVLQVTLYGKHCFTFQRKTTSSPVKCIPFLTSNSIMERVVYTVYN